MEVVRPSGNVEAGKRRPLCEGDERKTLLAPVMTEIGPKSRAQFAPVVIFLRSQMDRMYRTATGFCDMLRRSFG